MKITMMTRWNAPCGVSVHAELIGRALAELGHEIRVLAPAEPEEILIGKDEPWVERCYTANFFVPPGSKTAERRFFNPEPFLRDFPDIFIVQNLESLPMEELYKGISRIKENSKTVLVIHEGKMPKNRLFYRFDWDAIVCFDEHYKRMLEDAYPQEKIKIIAYPCHPYHPGDKNEARERLNLPDDKKTIFNFGPAVHNHIHILPTLRRINENIPIVFLTLTYSNDWYELFEALKAKYKFIDLRKGPVPLNILYTYLHASDCLLLHKGPSEGMVVSSTVFLCLGTGIPILCYDTNFFKGLDREVLKYDSLEGERGLKKLLEDVFEGKENVTSVLKAVREFVEYNSAYRITKRFTELFEDLLERG